MSAYLVSDKHIDIIVSHFVGKDTWIMLPNGEYVYLNKENAKLVAKALHQANVDSINCRYRENSKSNYSFTYRPEADDYTQGEIAKALDGYDYQACEVEDYDTSYAGKLINMFRKKLLQDTDYNEAETWSIN